MMEPYTGHHSFESLTLARAHEQALISSIETEMGADTHSMVKTQRTPMRSKKQHIIVQSDGRIAESDRVAADIGTEHPAHSGIIQSGAELASRSLDTQRGPHATNNEVESRADSMNYTSGAGKKMLNVA